MTEFKNASSDIEKRHAKHSWRPRIWSPRVKHARGYFLGVGVLSMVFQNDNAERITTDWRWERYEHWHEQPGRKRTWTWTRKRETPRDSRRPFASQIQSDINRSCEGRDRHMELASNQVSVYFCRQIGHLPGIVRIAGRVTTLESTSSVHSAALWR